MGLFSFTDTPVVQRAFKNEFEDFVNSYSVKSLTEQFKPDITGNDVCVRVLPNTSAMQSLIKINRLTHVDDGNLPDPKDFKALFTSITSSIINIDNAGNFNSCLTKLKAIKEALGPLFYGALLLDGSTLINPLHPLVAMRMLSSTTALDTNKNYRLAIFTYKTPESYVELYKMYREDRADHSKIVANINAQIQAYATQVTTEVEILRSNTSTDAAIIDYRVQKHPDEYQDEEYYLSVHQVLTLGVVMPYYGTSVISLSAKKDTSGLSVTPMRSCNISSQYDSSNSHVNTKTSLKDVVINFTSVCTGSENKRTLKGIRTLSHSNASSPYTTDIIAVGALTYAAECANKAFAIYTQANFFKES